MSITTHITKYKRHNNRYLFLLLIFLGSLFFTNIGSYPLDTPDGARYSEIPREMLATHDYVTPHLDGVKYFEKPPLFYWLQAGSLKVFGNTEFAANLVNALMGLMTCVVVFFAISRLFGSLQGLFSALILGTSAIFFVLARVATLDMTLTLFLTTALLCFLLANKELSKSARRNYLWLMYICAALATMTKGLIGIVFPGCIILFWVLICNEWSKLKNYCIPVGILIFLIITLPWHILVQYRNPEFFNFYFLEQHFLRYFTDYAGRSQVWWFLPATVIGGFFPWIFWLPQAIRVNLPGSWRQNCKQHKNELFLVIWAAFIYIFYTFSNSQLLPYTLPILPPLAILTGNYLTANWHSLKNKSRGFNAGLYLVTIFCAVLGLIVFAVIFAGKVSLGAIPVRVVYSASIILFFGSLITILIYRHFGISRSLSFLIVSIAVFLFSISPALTIANDHSIKPIAMVLKRQLSSETEVACYKQYYQDLPFYLERIVTIVNYKGELAFGSENQVNSDDWLIDTETFWHRWDSKKKMFMIIDKRKYASLENKSKHNFFVVTEGAHDLLLTNRID